MCAVVCVRLCMQEREKEKRKEDDDEGEEKRRVSGKKMTNQKGTINNRKTFIY